MKLITIFLFLIPFHVYAYTLKDQSLTQYEYTKYVRPQLKSIIQDYKTLIILLNKDLTQFKSNILDFRKLIDDAATLEDKCPQIKSELCINILREIHKDFFVLLEKFENQNIKLELTKDLDKKIDSYSMLEMIRLEITQNFIKIDTALMEYTLDKKISLNSKEIFNLAEKNYILFNLLLLKNSNEELKTPLHTYWLSFVRPVYKYILIKNDKEYFQKNLTELNIRWNELSNFLTKKVKNIPRQALTLVNIMHNRWNNILKVTLRPLP